MFLRIAGARSAEQSGGIGVSIEKRSEGLSQESAADPHL